MLYCSRTTSIPQTDNMFIMFQSVYIWKDCQSIHTKITCVTRNTNNKFSWKKLHSRDYKNWHFICHMCVSSEPITVAKTPGQFTLCFMPLWFLRAGSIHCSHKIQSEYYASICLYLLNVLPYNTSVIHTTPVHFWHHIMCNSSQCFPDFSWWLLTLFRHIWTCL